MPDLQQTISVFNRSSPSRAKRFQSSSSIDAMFVASNRRWLQQILQSIVSVVSFNRSMLLVINSRSSVLQSCEIKVPDFPSKLFFFCDEEPGSGGQTPIVLSHIVYDKMKESHPNFIAHMEKHGLRYMVVMNDEDQLSSYGGRGWKSAYMTDDKKVAEERAAKHGAKLEWMKGNMVKVITGPLPAIKFDNNSEHYIWFNNTHINKTSRMKGNIDDHDTYVELGNGDLVPDHVVEDCLNIMEEEYVVIPWKKGDVMLVNNLSVLHRRQPLLKPPRRILVSLCK